MRGPKLNTVLPVRPHQCRVQGHDPLPTPAGHTIPDTSQDAVGLLGHLGILLAHVQLAVNQHPKVLLCQAAFQPLLPKPVSLHGVVVTKVQDLALGLVAPHIVALSPSIQPVLPLSIRRTAQPKQLFTMGYSSTLLVSMYHQTPAASGNDRAVGFGCIRRQEARALIQECPYLEIGAYLC